MKLFSPASAENKVLSSMGSRGSQDVLPEGRPKSVGSGSISSSSSSSGRGSLSPVGYLCGPKRRGVSGGLGYISRPEALEEDDLDQGGGSQNLLCECVKLKHVLILNMTSILSSIYCKWKRELVPLVDEEPSISITVCFMIPERLH